MSLSEGMSPADFAAINNSNDGFGGNNAWWIIILFLFVFCGWNNGNYGGGGNAPVYASYNADMQRGFDQSALTGKLDNINSSICNGFSNAETSRANMAANLTNQLNTIAMAQQNCCCENRAAVADLKYTVATENCADRSAISMGVRDIIDNNNNGVRAILDKLCSQEIDALKTRNNELLAEKATLQNQISQTAQNGFIQAALNAQTAILNPSPIPAYVVQNPNGCGAYSGCGSCGA